MPPNRREFIKWTSAAGIGGAALGLGLGPGQPAAAGQLEIDNAKKTTSICPYCAVGCGIVVYTDKTSGKVIHIAGDPDHPINEGALCAKGAGLYQMVVNPQRLTEVRYRAPYSSKWETKSWDWALDRIAKRIKKTRDASFVKTDAQGWTVGRTEAIAHLGSAALDNEECWTLQAIMRALGLVYIEHQARI